MTIINDPEFGEIKISKNPRASQVRIKLSPDGSLKAVLPSYAPIFLVKRLIKNSRPQIRQLLRSKPRPNYIDGTRIGKTHQIKLISGSEFKVDIKNRFINVHLKAPEQLDQTSNLLELNKYIIKALRSEAKRFLPDRLEFLARQNGFIYNKVRFSHAGSRWGSCSSQKTISLNIALMKLPDELIDYVLLHELTHTEQMNHSQLFWSRLGSACPNYKSLKKQLKQQNPAI